MISVILPTYNNGAYLDDVVQSYLQQDLSDASEILVIDDGSSDDTAQVLTKFDDPKLRIIRFIERQGVISARNAGMREARGDLLVFSVGDAVVPENYLQNYETLLSSDDVDGIVGPTKITVDDSPDLFVRYLNRNRSPAQYTKTPLPPEYVTFTNLGIRRELIARAGLFDTDFHGYGGHEMEYAHRLVREQYGRFFYAEEVATFRQRYRTFPQTREKFYQFGLTNLPLLLRRYPEYKRLYKVQLYEAAPVITAALVKILDGFLRFLIPVNEEGHVGGWLRIKPGFVQFWFLKMALGLAILRGYVEKD